MATAENRGAEPAAGGQFSAEIPFLHDLGVELRSMNGGRAEVALALQQRHMNSWQVTHGGIIMTMLDAAMAIAGRSLEPKALGGVTIEMKTSFLQPGGEPGDFIVAKGHAYYRTTTLCFCEGEVWNGERLVAKATGTFKFLKRLEAVRRLEG